MLLSNNKTVYTKRPRRKGTNERHTAGHISHSTLSGAPCFHALGKRKQRADLRAERASPSKRLKNPCRFGFSGRKRINDGDDWLFPKPLRQGHIDRAEFAPYNNPAHFELPQILLEPLPPRRKPLPFRRAKESANNHRHRSRKRREDTELLLKIAPLHSLSARSTDERSMSTNEPLNRTIKPEE